MIQIPEPISVLISDISHVRCLAIGGSVASGSADRSSDLDVFVFCDDEHLIEVCKEVRSRALKHFAEGCLVDDLYLARNFGIRLQIFTQSCDCIEIFFNSPAVFSAVPMARKMRFTSDNGRAYFERHFSDFVNATPTWRHELCGSILREGLAALRNMAKAVGRREWIGYKYYWARLNTLMQALELDRLGRVTFDPHAIERKLSSLERELDFDASSIKSPRSDMSKDAVLTNLERFIAAVHSFDPHFTNFPPLVRWRRVLASLAARSGPR